MAEIDSRTKFIDLLAHFDILVIDMMPDYGPITHFKAAAGREDEVYSNLSPGKSEICIKKQSVI